MKSILILAASKKAYPVSHSARHSASEYGGLLHGRQLSRLGIGNTPGHWSTLSLCHDITTEHKTDKVSEV